MVRSSPLALAATTRAAHTARLDAGYDQVQYTLVDCPGHASLIRTIIGGAQIMDLALLVIDAVKGIQTQTAEVLPCVRACVRARAVVRVRVSS